MFSVINNIFKHKKIQLGKENGIRDLNLNFLFISNFINQTLRDIRKKVNNYNDYFYTKYQVEPRSDKYKYITDINI